MFISAVLRRAASPAVLTATFAFYAANANAAPEDVKFGCRGAADVPALKVQVLEQEKMVPVASRSAKVVDKDGKVKFYMDAVMMNPETREGLEWSKDEDGKVCISKYYTNIELFDNSKFDGRALMLVEGKKPREIDANSVIAGASVNYGENPIMRANVYSPMAKYKDDPVNYPTRYVEYMLGNPKTTSGALLGFNFDGASLSYKKSIPSPQEAGNAFVKNGAMLTPVGQDIVKGMQISGVNQPPAFALNK